MSVLFTTVYSGVALIAVAVLLTAVFRAADDPPVPQALTAHLPMSSNGRMPPITRHNSARGGLGHQPGWRRALPSEYGRAA